MLNSRFEAMIDSKTIEGGAVYISECKDFGLTNVTFENQTSLVRGGALFA